MGRADLLRLLHAPELANRPKTSLPRSGTLLAPEPLRNLSRTLLLKRGSGEVPAEQFRSGSGAVPERFRSGSGAVLERFRSGSGARFQSKVPSKVLEGCWKGSIRFRRGSGARVRRAFEAVPKQTSWPEGGKEVRDRVLVVARKS